MGNTFQTGEGFEWTNTTLYLWVDERSETVDRRQSLVFYYTNILYNQTKRCNQMKISHIALYVEDLEKMREFYETYFGATANDKYHNPRTGLSTYFLSFDDQMRLEIMQRPDVTNHLMAPQLGYTHLAFSVGNSNEVDEITTRLASAGFQIVSGPRTNGDGYYESVVLDPENNQIEITK